MFTKKNLKIIFHEFLLLIPKLKMVSVTISAPGGNENKIKQISVKKNADRAQSYSIVMVDSYGISNASSPPPPTQKMHLPHFSLIVDKFSYNISC